VDEARQACADASDRFKHLMDVAMAREDPELRDAKLDFGVAFAHAVDQVVALGMNRIKSQTKES